MGSPILDAVTLDVISLARVGVVFGIDVACASAPLAFEASVVGPVKVVRVAKRGSRSALGCPMHCWNGGGLGQAAGWARAAAAV